MIVLPDIFRISEFQTAGDFHFCARNIRCLVAISTPAISLAEKSIILVLCFIIYDSFHPITLFLFFSIRQWVSLCSTYDLLVFLGEGNGKVFLCFCGTSLSTQRRYWDQQTWTPSCHNNLWQLVSYFYFSSHIK